VAGPRRSRGDGAILLFRHRHNRWFGAQLTGIPLLKGKSGGPDE